MFRFGAQIAIVCFIGVISKAIFGICGPIGKSVAGFIDQPGYEELGVADHIRQKRCHHLYHNLLQPEIVQSDLQPKWDTPELTWNYLPKNRQHSVTEKSVRDIIQRALNLWAGPSGLRFRELPSYMKADLQISFEKPIHSINLRTCDPFDKDVVAHAFSPDDLFFKGQIHINSDQVFSTRGEPGKYDLFQVVLHELGHTLGLGHSQSLSRPKPVMWNYYQPDTTVYQLQQDDIEKIMALYRGRRRAFRFLAYPYNLEIPFIPSFCKNLGLIDAAFEAPNSTAYILHGHTYTLFNNLTTPISEGLIHDRWKELETPVDAAYADLHKNQIVFFKSPNYWRYTNGTLDAGFPKQFVTDDSSYSDFNKIDAAVTLTESDIYLFKGDAFYKYDDTNNSISNKVTIPIAQHFGQINATVRFGGLLYMFQGNKINAVPDTNILKISKGNEGNELPMDLSDFFQCPSVTSEDSTDCSC